VYFATLHYKQQQQWVMFWFHSVAQYWVKMQENNQQKFIPYTFQVPILNNPETNNLKVEQKTLSYVCMLEMQILAGKKKNFWCTCVNAVKTNTILEHGLVGKQGIVNTILSETLDIFYSFYLKSELFCYVRPTQFVREKTKQTERDDGQNLLHLPSYWSRCSLFSLWCYEQGCVQKQYKI
jgi:hypothetical protein